MAPLRGPIAGRLVGRGGVEPADLIAAIATVGGPDSVLIPVHHNDLWEACNHSAKLQVPL